MSLPVSAVYDQLDLLFEAGGRLMFTSRRSLPLSGTLMLKERTNRKIDGRVHEKTLGGLLCRFVNATFSWYSYVIIAVFVPF